MVALSAKSVRASRRLGKMVSYSAGVGTIYAGALVMIDANGFALPAAASLNNNGCVGVAIATVDNSGGSAGDLKVTVQEGEFLFAADTIAQANVGERVYADDDNTIDETQATNAPLAGLLVEFVSASEGWVSVSMTNSKH